LTKIAREYIIYIKKIFRGVFMDIKISYSKLSSFVGDVRPLWLKSDVNLKFKGINWSVKGDAVSMKTCGGCSHGAFRYGVFLTFVKAGNATVTASYDGVDYVCEITSRERRDYSDMEMKFWKGDLHTHTTPEHIHDKFTQRTEYLHKDYLEYIKNDEKRDLAVMTDHSETIDLENFFRSFTEYEEMKDGIEPIVYAGCENEIMYSEDGYNFTKVYDGLASGMTAEYETVAIPGRVRYIRFVGKGNINNSLTTTVTEFRAYR
jgi:hypothetical protein